MCRILLNKYDNEDTTIKLPELYDYCTIISPQYPTRASDGDCNCTICQLCTKGPYEQDRKDDHFIANKEVQKKRPTDLKLCTSCLSPIAKDKQHTCSKTTFYNNVVQLTEQYPGGAGDKIVSKIIKKS